MKKMIFAALFVAGTCLFTEAKATITAIETIQFTVSQNEGFVEVKLEDLNEKVQAAVNGNLEAYNLKVLTYDVEKKQTKATLESKADQSEKVLLLDDEGKEIEQVKEAEEVKKEVE